jgi:hypothetical protein
MKETMQMGVFRRPAKPYGLGREYTDVTVSLPDDPDALLEPAGSH